jgi:hypothetical protein
MTKTAAERNRDSYIRHRDARRKQAHEYYVAHKDEHAERVRKYLLKNRDKHNCRQKVRHALAGGRIAKPMFCDCGSLYPQAHHEDYSKPLEVLWVCRDCHRKLHSERMRNMIF